jgi:hypothetical protein
VAVTFTKAAVIALDRGLDQACRVAGGTFETVLTKGNSDVLAAGVSLKLTGLCVSKGGLTGRGPHVPLNGGSNQRAQLVIVHSTHSS